MQLTLKLYRIKIGIFIQQARVNLKLTRDELAKSIGISLTTLFKVENALIVRGYVYEKIDVYFSKFDSLLN